MDKPVGDAQMKSFDQGRYRLQSVLGRGAHGTVYEAYDPELDVRVAIKLLEITGANPDIPRTMFKREVGALATLEHDHVVRMLRYFADESKGQLGIVLERIPGGQPLSALIHDPNPPPCAQRMRWRLLQLLGLLDGLERAHRLGIIHRDIKPSNVLFDHQLDRLKLADFGVAKVLENYGRSTQDVTLRAFYTPPFAAPEQVLGREVHFPADMHAFGVLAASLLTWQLPAEGFTRAKLVEFLQPLATAVGDAKIADQLRVLISRMMRTEPSERPLLPDVVLALRQALDALTEREPAPVAVTDHAHRRAQEFGLVPFSVALADLNAGLRVRIEPGRDEAHVLRVLGRTLQAVLKQDEEQLDRLVMVDLIQPSPASHASSRERSAPAGFLLEEGRGSAQAFFDEAWEEHQRRVRALAEEAQKKDLLHLAKFILEKQRERMGSLRVRYEMEGENHGARRTKRISSEVCELRVLGVQLASEEAEAPPEEELMQVFTSSLAEDLDHESVFLSGGKLFGHAHGYDEDTQILRVRLRKPVSLPTRGTLDYRDIALETSLKRQEKAMETFFADTAVNPRLGELILHPERNTLTERPYIELIQPLEPRGEIADLISRMLATRDLFLVQGPPGTGKTTLIAELMAQILDRESESRILLTSQANEAVDNALDALKELVTSREQRARIVRDASERRQKETGAGGFDEAFRAWAEEAIERSLAVPPTLRQDQLSVEQETFVRRALTIWAFELRTSRDARQDFAAAVQVFGMTCLRVPVLWRLLREQDVRFDWVIIDEAARATPTELLVALVMGRRFILVGDQRQLPPFLDTETLQDLREEGITEEEARTSLFEKLFDVVPPSNRQTLRVQYRMHRSIADFVSELYYADIGLETGVADEDRELAFERFADEQRVRWLDVPEGGERQEKGETSYWNHEETLAIERLLKQLELEARQKKVCYSVGVIAAYAKQATKLRERLSPNSKKRWRALNLRVNTVDAFQGKQEDIILYSMVRTKPQSLRFISNKRRLNVAFSRARRLLVIVGHREALRGSEELRRVISAVPDDAVFTDPGGA